MTALLLAGCALTPREYPELAMPRAAGIEPLRAPRPLVALVLGAGGSRGFAHVGVIKALEAAGVLTATVRLVDPAQVGRGVNVLCNVRMRSHALDARSAFEQFVDGRPEVVECFSMSGEWDYLLRVVVADVADYNQFLMHTLLAQPTVAGAASHFALSTTKYTTALPV